jgi:hypothetical protein
MTTATLRGSDGRFRLAWLAGTLALALAAGVLVGWPAAAALAGLGIWFVALPFMLVPALVLAAVAAGFVNYEGGHLTALLSGLSILLTYALMSLVVAATTRRWGLPASRFTTAVLLVQATTLVAAVHGILVGNSLRFLGLEMLPFLGMMTALALGGLRLDRRALRLPFALFAAAGVVQVGLGVYAYVLNRTRVGGVYFTPVPGFLAVLTFNLLLRSRSTLRTLGLTVLTSLFLLQQLMSLTRGYWMGLFVAFVYTGLFYTGRGEGVGRRWRTLLGRVGVMSGLLAAGAVVAAGVLGWGDIGALLGTRLASSVGTTQSSETASNVVRMVEWLHVARDIAASPWLGYGLGYSFHVRFPFFDVVSSQWFAHEQYLLTWLKQGVFGLLALLYLLYQGARMATQGMRRLSDPEEVSWCAAAAGSTLYIAVLGLTNFPLAQVNPTFTLAFLWGVALALQAPPRTAWVWRRPAGAGEAVVP